MPRFLLEGTRGLFRQQYQNKIGPDGVASVQALCFRAPPRMFSRRFFFYPLLVCWLRITNNIHSRRYAPIDSSTSDGVGLRRKFFCQEPMRPNQNNFPIKKNRAAVSLIGTAAPCKKGGREGGRTQAALIAKIGISNTIHESRFWKFGYPFCKGGRETRPD